MTAEEKRSYLTEQLGEESDSAENNYVSDSDDEEWFPVSNKQAMSSEMSDYEETEEDQKNQLKIKDELIIKSENESDEETNTVNEAIPVHQSLKLTANFVAKDKTIWTRTPTVQRSFRNILRHRSGPHKNTETLSIVDTFKVIFTSEMVNIIVHHTNRKASQVYRAYNEANPTKKQLSWKDITNREFYGFLGILISSGINNSNYDYTIDMWRSSSYPLYRATMGINRFWNILRFIRFDDANTRRARIEEDKVAPIRDIWTMLNSNLVEMYRPTDCLTIYEQLFPYCGRTGFTQYIPAKPAKCGIKVWWMCDAENLYPLQGHICTENPAQGCEVNQSERAIKELALPYKDSGRNITMDDCFTSLPLAKFLMSWNLTIVGTLKSNKKYIPTEMAASESHEMYSSLFGFHENVTICSYVPEQNKVMLLLSTMHANTNVSATQKKKPEIIQYYNKTKIGDDTMDQMLQRYTTKRQTQRWSLAFFYNIVDVASLAAYILYYENNKMINKKANERRYFLRQLSEELCMPSIEDRSENPQIMRHFSIKNAVESIFGRPVNNVTSTLVLPNTLMSSVQKYDLTGRKIVVGSCYICNKGAFKKRRKTRKACDKCRKPVCNEHTVTTTHCIECTACVE